jgi:ankyrin repeat protein
MTPVWIAAISGHASMVKALIAAGADPSTPNKDGQTPVFIASYAGRVAVVKALLAAGANPSTATPEDGWTPVWIAARNNHLDVINALVAAGANPSTATATGNTPVFVAESKGHTLAAALLRQHGAAG